MTSLSVDDGPLHTANWQKCVLLIRNDLPTRQEGLPLDKEMGVLSLQTEAGRGPPNCVQAQGGFITNFLALANSILNRGEPAYPCSGIDPGLWE